MTEPEIKKIQEFLKIPKTGIYDEFTEAAIRNFQIKNKLKVTGLIDNETLQLVDSESNLGRISTNLMETNLTITNRFLNQSEYYKGPTKKRAIFLHFTAGSSNPLNVVEGWERDERGKVGTHFVIGGINLFTNSAEFDGDIVQCMPSYENYAWHLGIGNTALHRETIGIELCSYGPIKFKNGAFWTWNDKKVQTLETEKQVGRLQEPFRGYEFYHKISDAQLNSLYFLIKKIAQENQIDLGGGLKEFLKTQTPNQAFDYQPNVHADRIKSGLFCHTHVSPKNKYGNYEKWDMFPQPELIDMINSL
jgi:hypothetical protein